MERVSAESLERVSALLARPSGFPSIPMRPRSRTARLALLLAVPASLVSASSSLGAQTVTVTTVEDVTDFGGARRVEDLPGPDGLVSFREAVLASNNTPGPQSVHFAIPQAGWWFSTEMAILKLENGVFLVTDDDTTLDFSTQTTFTGDTNPNGTEVGIYGLEANGWGTPAIIVRASRCTVRGLGWVSQRGASVAVWGGDDNRIVGCTTGTVELDPYPGTTTGNVIGGTDPADGNVIDFIDILCGADDNLVIGNRIRSVSVVGSQYCTLEYPTNNRIGGPTAAERNVITGAGSYSSEGFPTGRNVYVYWAQDTLVEGNYVGVEADGITRVPQVAPTGIGVDDSVDTTVRGNLVSGMRVVGRNHYAGQVFGQAIQVGAINQDGIGTVLEGNLVGTDATGTLPVLTRSGIVVNQATGRFEPHAVRIGGLAPGQGNTVAFTELNGIAVLGNIDDAEISGNSIHGNGLLGIELGSFPQGPDGVTPNDPGDADSGANGLQNFPTIESASTAFGTVAVRGLLGSEPFSSYRVELFASAECDPSGHGEGRSFLGSVLVSTDVNGDAAFEVTLSRAVEVGAAVTATATNVATSATSEFGPCTTVTGRGRSGGPKAGLAGRGLR